MAARILYLPIGRKTFDMATAESYYRESIALLQGTSCELAAPDGILTSGDELEDFLSRSVPNPDFILFQMVTFADAEFIVKVMEKREQRVVVWSVREPEVGGRLRLNSLTGGNSSCHALRFYGREYDFWFGNPTEPKVMSLLKGKTAALEAAAKLKQLTVGIVGEHPPGFFFSGADEMELHKRLGVKVRRLDLHQAFKSCMELSEAEWRPMLDNAMSRVIGLNPLDETVVKFAKFSSYLKKELLSQSMLAIAVRCWPDFFTELGAAACSTLSQFTEDGIVSSCESDVHGAITMYIQRELSGGSAPYLGDMVHLDEESNSVVFWHCGAGAYSLAHPSTGARAGVHPNRKMGFAMDFGLKPGQVTISRLSKSREGYRMLIMRGEALDEAQKFHGTSVQVRLAGKAEDIVHSLMMDGMEPHYSLVYSDIVHPLTELCKLLQIETVVYQ